jgi:hypothetical protein
MSKTANPRSKGGATMPLPPPPGSADAEVDLVVTTRNNGPALLDLVRRLPGDGVHELFIVDDGSTDADAQEMLGRLEAAGYQVVRQDHCGLSRARNEGTRASRAPYLLYLDADTVPIEGFLVGAASKLNAESTIAAVVANGQWQGSGQPIVVSKLDVESVVTAVQFESVAVFRRAAIEKVGGWDEQLESCLDRDLFLSLAETGWSFAKLQSTGFTRSDADERVVHSPVSPADGTRIAEKHREIYAAHLTAVVGAYESALAEAGITRPPSDPGDERTVHGLMDQLAAARSDLARSEADGIRARSLVADVQQAARQSAAAREETEQAKAVLQEQIEDRDREIAAVHATKTLRLARVPRSIYARARRWLG